MRTKIRFQNPALAIARAVVQHAEKANAQIGTFGFADPQAKRKKPKEPIFFASTRTDQQ